MNTLYIGFIQKHLAILSFRDLAPKTISAYISCPDLPVFYRMVPGNVADKAALKETAAASDCRNYIVIADKGFYSKKNVSFLIENKMSYILPLQYNTRLIPDEFVGNMDNHKFDGCFTYKSRNIWHKIGQRRKRQ